MKEKHPVFIFGIPRSGTTLLMDLISNFDKFAWISQYNNRLPGLPAVSLLSKVYDIPVIGNYLRKSKPMIQVNKSIFARILPHPNEFYFIMNYILGEFPKYAMTVDYYDKLNLPSQDQVENFRNIFEAIRKFQNKDILVCKYADKPHIEFFDYIFKDSKFILQTRNPYSTINSLHKKSLNSGWFQDNFIEGWMKRFPKTWVNRINESSEKKFTFITFYYYDMFIRNVKALDNIDSSRYIITEYEKLLQDPISCLENVIEFIGYDLDADYIDFINSRNLKRSSLDKWKEGLGIEHKEIIKSIGDQIAEEYSFEESLYSNQNFKQVIKY